MVIADSDSFLPLLEQGVTMEQIRESQEILHSRGFVRLRHSFGTDPHDAEVTPSGFQLYAKKNITSFEKIIAEIGRLIIGGQHMDNRALAESLSQPIRIITQVLAHFESKGWLQTGEAYGGGYQHTDVLWVSPELKRWLERL
jgi:hypothetical protein